MSPKHGPYSLNQSLTNDTSLFEVNKDEKFDYADFIKRFCRSDLDDVTGIKLLGCEKTIGLIKDKIENLLSSDNRGADFALITGPSGTGKTTVVRKLAKDFHPRLKFFYLKASWMLERQFGNPETQIRKIFEEAEGRKLPDKSDTVYKPDTPSLIFIDKLDLVCADKRSQNDTRDRVFNVLEDKLEGLNNASRKILVLAATDRPEVLDPQIRKPCYFGEEIRFTLPSREDRKLALKYKTDQLKKSLTLEQIEQIADATHCYSFRDLDKLINKALRKCRKDNKGKLSLESMQWAMTQFKPVTIKSVTTPCPPLRWDDIGGVEFAKKELQESVIWPLEHRDKFKKLGISSNKGALLYGPPGCSKTMLAQALATESGYNFISVKGPELFSKWVGDSEAAVRRLYRNAREIAPCIIFFDEIDGFAPERSDNQSSSVGDKVVAQLLTELNGVEPLDNVFTIAATNRPDRVDNALLRPGRLDPAIYIPLPNGNHRAEIFQVHMRPLSLKFEGETLGDVIKKLVSRTEGYSGAEIANICRVAGTLALRESLENEHIEWRHFEMALATVQPRTRADQLLAYERFQARSLQSSGKERRRLLSSCFGWRQRRQ